MNNKIILKSSISNIIKPNIYSGFTKKNPPYQWQGGNFQNLICDSTSAILSSSVFRITSNTDEITEVL